MCLWVLEACVGLLSAVAPPCAQPAIDSLSSSRALSTTLAAEGQAPRRTARRAEVPAWVAAYLVVRELCEG